MQPKAFENITKAELLDWIEDLFRAFQLWRCTRCGGWGKRGNICSCCDYDPTAPKE